MKTFLKLFGYLCLGVVGVLILAIIVLKSISDTQYKSWMIAAAESATGRICAINGPFELHFGSNLKLLAHDLSLSNTSWGSKEHMVRAQRLHIQVALLPLLKGVLDLSLDLNEPDILLETNADGVANWAFTKDAAPSEPQITPAEQQKTDTSFVLPVKPYIRNFKITNLNFNFNSRGSEQSHNAQLKLLRLFVENGELPIIIDGAYQHAPITLKGTLGQIDDWYANKQTPIALQGILNEAEITINGSAGPLFPQPNAQFDLLLKSADIASFTPFVGIDLPALANLDISVTTQATKGQVGIDTLTATLNDPQLHVAITGMIEDISNLRGIDLNARVTTNNGTALGQQLGILNIESVPNELTLKSTIQGDLNNLSLNDLQLTIQDTGVDISLTGKMKDIQRVGDINATLNAQIDSLDTLGAYIGQPIPGLGPVELSATIASPEGITQLQSLELSVNDPSLTTKISGSTGQILMMEQQTLAIEDISITAAAGSSQLPELLSKLGINLPGELPPNISLETKATGTLDKLGIDQFELRVSDEGLNLSVTGSADNIREQSGISANLIGDIATTAYLSKFAGMEIPDMGRLTLQGEIQSTGKTYTLDTFNLNLDGPDTKSTVTAEIQDILALTKITQDRGMVRQAGATMSVDLDIRSLAQLVNDFTGIAIPDLGSMHAAAHLSTIDDFLRLEALELNLESEALNSQIEASVANLLTLLSARENPDNLATAGLDLSLKADTESVSNLTSSITGIKIPNLGSLTINGRITSSEQALKLDTLNAVLQREGIKTTIDATVADIQTLSGLSAKINGDIDSLGTLSDIIKRHIPHTGPWHLAGHASSERLKESPLIFNATLEGEGTKTVIDASIPNLKSPQTIIAKLTSEAATISTIGPIINRELPDAPVKISANLAAESGKYDIDKLLVLLGEGTIQSNLTFNTADKTTEERGNLLGYVAIDNIDITPFIESESESTDPAVEQADSVKEIVEEVEQEESGREKKLFSSEPLAFGVLQTYDAELKLDARDFTINEAFTVDGELELHLQDGLLSLDPFTFNGKKGGSATGQIELDASNPVADLDVLLDFDEFVPPRFGGKLFLDADLQSRGESVAELMGNLDGIFIIRLNDLHMEKTLLSQFGSGLISQINPLSKDTTVLECAIARLDIEDGFVDFEKKLAAQTTEVTWMGGGEINLKTEEIDMGVAPKARAAISSLTNINLASLIHIGGTLADLQIGLDAADVAKKYAQYSVAIATGGLSFLAQKAYENRVSNFDQCERILADSKEKK